MKVRKFKEKELIFCAICLLILIIFVILFKWKGLIILPLLIGGIYAYWNRKKLKKKILKIIKDYKNKGNKKEENEISTSIKEKKGINVMKRKLKGNKRKKIGSKNKKGNKRLLTKVLYLFIGLCIFAFVSVIGFFAYIVMSTSKFDPEALASLDQTVVYDLNGETIATLGREKRESISYSDLPQVLIDAIVATEDSRFYQHNGVDLARFTKASIGQVLSKVGIGSGNAGGASTLTMQVVKNNLTSTKQSITRKFKDVYLSVFFLEKKYTKEEILEFYVNDSLLGGNVYGVGQASEYYFGKSVSELSLPEASLLAGLFQSPNGDNPYNNPERATKRRNTVLKLMVRHKYITQEEADIANSITVESLLIGSSEKNNYQGYIDTVVEEIKSKTGDDPYLVPMKIYTNMEKSIQDGINSVLNGDVYTWENDVVQSGISVINVETGAIAAIGAGRNREGEKTFNYATMAKKQPGSTAKPLFDYGPGFEYNNYSTYTLFVDEPWSYTGTNNSVGNWDGGYQGLITLKTALAGSRNVTALKAFQDNKKSNITTFVNNLGIKVDNINEAYAIGGLDTGVSPLQMAGAYTAFASGGYYVEPYTTSKIEYRSTGKVVDFNYTKERVMADSTAYLVNNVLEYAVTSGLGSGGASSGGSHVAAKTGTSNFDEATIKKYHLDGSAVNDLWTVAYTSKYTMALWYGYKELSSEFYNRSYSPKNQVVSAVMKYIPYDTVGFTVPSSVVSSQVEFGTWPAKLPSDQTPSDLIVTEYFKKGTQPSEVSERFSKLNDITNIKSTNIGNKITLTWNYETPQITTESYLKEYFSQSVFGNSTDTLLQQRLSYNNDTLGGLGFGIYEKTDSGLKEIAFVTSKTYTYTATNSSVKALIVKAEYKNFKANASNGTEVSISSSVIDSGIKIDIGNKSTTFIKGNFDDNDIIVYYNNKKISNLLVDEITYSLINNSISTEYSSYSQLKVAINKLDPGTYKIKYTVTHKGDTTSDTKTLIVE